MSEQINYMDSPLIDELDVQLQCLNHNEGNCQGPVEYRSTGRGRAFPRCDFHWTKRLKLEDEIIAKYNPDGTCPPAGFDPADAGERWDSDY